MFDIKEQLIERLKNTGLGFKPVKVLSIEEAEEYARLYKNINIVSSRYWNNSSNTDLMLLTNDYCFGTFVHDKQWVHSSHVVPMTVASRETIPDGRIKNVKELIDLFYPEPNRIFINTIDEFADWLIKTNSYYNFAEEQREKLKYGISK